MIIEDTERWAYLPKMTDYIVSNHGKVLSLKGIDKKYHAPLGSRGREIKFQTNNKVPHLFFQAYDSVGKKYKTLYIHKVVAQKFVDKPSRSSIHVIHIDGDPTNNHYTNLKWITARQAALRRGQTRKQNKQQL